MSKEEVLVNEDNKSIKTSNNPLVQLFGRFKRSAHRGQKKKNDPLGSRKEEVEEEATLKKLSHSASAAPILAKGGSSGSLNTSSQSMSRLSLDGAVKSRSELSASSLKLCQLLDMAAKVEDESSILASFARQVVAFDAWTPLKNPFTVSLMQLNHCFDFTLEQGSVAMAMEEYLCASQLLLNQKEANHCGIQHIENILLLVFKCLTPALDEENVQQQQQQQQLLSSRSLTRRDLAAGRVSSTSPTNHLHLDGHLNEKTGTWPALTCRLLLILDMMSLARDWQHHEIIMLKHCTEAQAKAWKTLPMLVRNFRRLLEEHGQESRCFPLVMEATSLYLAHKDNGKSPQSRLINLLQTAISYAHEFVVRDASFSYALYVVHELITVYQASSQASLLN